MKKQFIIAAISYNTLHSVYFMTIKDGLKEVSISRTSGQLSTDLTSVGLTLGSEHLVKNCKAEAVLTYHKMGDQVIDQDGKDATNEDGSARKYKKDGASFDGFVSIEASQTIAIAQLVVAQMTIAPIEVPVAPVVAESFAPADAVVSE